MRAIVYKFADFPSAHAFLWPLPESESAISIRFYDGRMYPYQTQKSILYHILFFVGPVILYLYDIP